MSELAKEVEDLKPGNEQEIDYCKQISIESKTTNVVQKVLNILPQAAETTSTFTPLAPFGKLIGKGFQQIIDGIRRRKSTASS